MTFDALPIATPEGYFVSRQHQRIAEIIQDFDPTLFLAFIPPSQRDPNDPTEHPWAVIHIPDDAPSYIVFYADHCDERILTRIFVNDTTRHDVLKTLEAKDAAEEAIRLKKQMEREEENADMAKSLIRSPLHTYKLNGKKLEL